MRALQEEAEANPDKTLATVAGALKAKAKAERAATKTRLNLFPFSFLYARPEAVIVGSACRMSLNLLNAAAAGDPKAAAELLTCSSTTNCGKLAAVRMAEEQPGQTLQATALVHEAYVRLVGPGDSLKWNGRGHFFAAAAESMRVF